MPASGAHATLSPRRGNKATTFEGGVRSIAFISGAGLAPAVRGSVSLGLMPPTAT